jgi:hypothetical protein
MSRTVRLTLALGLVAALVFATTTTAAASGRKVFSSSMVGLPTGSLVLDGLTGGGVPWSIDEGAATLTADGRLHVEVQGLVVTSTGVNPVTSGRAIVTCAGTPVASTDTVPFSTPGGNAEVDAQVTLPSPCLDLAVFFTTASNRWLAVTGA